VGYDGTCVAGSAGHTSHLGMRHIIVVAAEQAVHKE
jgi:hypothetical protein